MGGSGEDDNAMAWFLERVNGGDVLVLRCSGSDGYNNYLYSDLGVNVNSVETLVFTNPNAVDLPKSSALHRLRASGLPEATWTTCLLA